MMTNQTATEEPALAHEGDSGSVSNALVDAQIQVTCQCRTCNGARVLYDDRWQEMLAFSEKWARDNPMPKDENGNGIYEPWMTQRQQVENQWWAEQGYPDPSRLPPEEYDCGDCEGTGRETVSVPLDAVLSR